MASSDDAPQPPRRQSATARTAREDDSDLTTYLQKLSISSDTKSPKSPHLEEPRTPLRSAPRHASRSPHRRATSRSPSTGPNGRIQTNASPSLHRKASMNSLNSANGINTPQQSLRRASSAQALSPTTPTGEPPALPVKIPLTPARIATDCLKTELSTLHDASSGRPAEVVVILHDSVYGHRYSRPRTSKATLSLIVERPERIKATILGVSLAYIRLGERHSEGVHALSPKRDVQDLPSIPFRIQKTDRRLSILSQAVTNVHGTKWMDELKGMCDLAEARLAAGNKELQRRPRSRGGSRGGDEPTPEKLHEGDLYLCSESLNAFEGALGAVCEGIDIIFNDQGPQRAFVNVRPPGHHCSASHPSGFCWVNNVHVGIMHAALHQGLTHAAIIDFDLHHGDGSQAIAWQQNKRANAATKNAAAWKKTSIGYFSLHDINSYPCEGGDDEKIKNASLCIDNAHGQSIWNVHLQPWASEQEFWQLYESRYSVLLEKTRNYLKNQAQRLTALNQTPRAAIFFSAGFDASEWESAGMQRHPANVPTEFYARLSRDVVKLAAEEGLGVDGRVMSVLEGGYSDRALSSGVFGHLCGLVPSDKAQPTTADTDGSNGEAGLAPDSSKPETMEQDVPTASALPYDPSWWSGSALDTIQELVAAPPEIPKKPRQPSVPTYFSPTQASTAKVVDPLRMRRSLSGLSSKGYERPPSPPPPEVPWSVAAHELSKLLIPSDRQTDSCKAEDLNAEATRARQARQSILNKATPASTPERPGSKMNLRGRKPRATAAPVEEVPLAKDRRKTVATSTISTDSVRDPKKREKDDKLTKEKQSTTAESRTASRRTSRRLSGVALGNNAASDAAPPMPNTSRAGPSTESRPDLAAAGRSQSATNLAARKARTPAATPRKQAAARAGRAPKASGSAANPIAEASRSVPQAPATEPRKTTQGPFDDIDNITKGMKKIKINLITKSQKEAKERTLQQANASATASDTLDAERPPYSSGPGSPLISPTTVLPSNDDKFPEPVPKEESPTPIKSEEEPQSIPDVDLSAPHEHVGYDDDSVSSLPPHKTSSPESRSSDIPQVAIQPSSDPADVFIAYQPEGPTPMAAAPTEPLKWLPPNVSTSSTPAATPSPVKKQDRLFHYTPGSIPFAPRPVPKENVPIPKEESQSPTTWDIPETPNE